MSASFIRKLDEGRSAELEMGEFLTRHGYANTAPVLGAIEIERPRPHNPPVAQRKQRQAR